MNLPLILSIAAAVLCSGCATKGIALSPRPPLTGSTAGMQVTDARKVEPYKRLVPLPEQASLLGAVFWLKTGTAADLVASVVATKYPGAAVKVLEFVVDEKPSFYHSHAGSRIAAEITPSGEPAFTVRGEGVNTHYGGNVKNWDIAVERALEDFRSHFPAASPH